jgi:hypothetical protein
MDNRYPLRTFDNDDRDGYRARATRSGAYPDSDSHTQPNPSAYSHADPDSDTYSNVDTHAYIYAYIYAGAYNYTGAFGHSGFHPGPGSNTASRSCVDPCADGDAFTHAGAHHNCFDTDSGTDSNYHQRAGADHRRHAGSNLR